MCMLRKLSALLILLASTVLRAGEVPLSEPVLQHAAGDQYGTTVTTDGTNFFAAWADGRGDRPAIYASRVSRNGAVLDGTGIRISANGGFPIAVWSGSSYLVLWSEQSSEPGYSVRMARVSSDGSIIEAARTLVSNAVVLSAASNGSRVLVGYTRTSAVEGRILVLDRDGQFVRDLPVWSSNSGGVSLSTNGSTFAAFWLSVSADQQATVVGIPLSADGVPDEAGPRTIALGYPVPDSIPVASDGSGYLLLMPGVRYDLAAVRLDASLNAVTPLHAVGAGDGAAVEQPRLVWTGSSYMVVFGDPANKQHIATRLDRDGNRIDTPVRLANWQTHGLVAYPALAAAGGDLLLVYDDARLSRSNVSTQYDIFAALFDASLSNEKEILVSISGNAQKYPVIATGAENLLGAWIEESGVYASRISPDGRALDGRGIAISDAEFPSVPQIVFDGAQYLVFWTESSVARMRRISPTTGAISEPVTIRDCANEIAIGTATPSWLATWTDCKTNALLASRIGPDGTLLDAVPLQVTADKTNNHNPHLAWNGSKFLAVWEEWTRSSPINGIFLASVRAARIAPALTLLDSTPIAVALTDGRIVNSHAAVASDGRDFLVIWGSSFLGIQGRAITAAGNAGDPFTLADNGSAPDLVWDGKSYFAAWQEQRASLDVIGTHVGTNDRVEISTSTADDRDVKLAAAGRETIVAAYTHAADDPISGGAQRAFERVVASAPRRHAAR